MAILHALSPDAEISTVAINSLINALGPFKNNALRLLAKQGITDLTPGLWYSQQSFLDAFHNIPTNVGDQTLFQIGKLLSRNLNFPPDIDQIETALALINTAYHEYYRNGETGSYIYRKTGEKECTMLCSSPYPCAFDQGVLTEICNLFRPADSDEVIVEHNSEPECRKNGNSACTFIIRW